jgi:hypothetical protein
MPQDGSTPLRRAVQSSAPEAPEVVQLLSAANADICAKDTSGKTPAAHLPTRAHLTTLLQQQTGRYILAEGKRRGVDPGYVMPTYTSRAYSDGAAYTSGAYSGGGEGGGGGCGGGCGGCGCGGGSCGS